MAETEKHPIRQPGSRKKKFFLSAAAACFLCLLVSCGSIDPPSIQGVPEQVTVYNDEDIDATLRAGVDVLDYTEDGGSAEDIQIAVYDQAGAEADPSQPGEYRAVYRYTDSSGGKAEEVETALTVLLADREPPVFSGVSDITAAVGEEISYRRGVTAVDAVDGEVPFQVDASQVNPQVEGQYPVLYSARDSRGNEASVTIQVTVEPAVTISEEEFHSQEPAIPASKATREDLDALADQILSQITNSRMTKREKAKAIYDYVHSHIRYVGTSDKSSWISAAYIGFTERKGDCFNYFACSKELLTRAQISNIDLQRVGGTSHHYWQLVNVGDGYYHFDACPHPNSYPLNSFLITEEQARDYTRRCSSVRKNYYVYDYASCPVPVVGLSEEERRPQSAGAETPVADPEPVPEATPAPQPDPVPETSPAPQPDPVPEASPAPEPDPAPQENPEPAPDPETPAGSSAGDGGEPQQPEETPGGEAPEASGESGEATGSQGEPAPETEGILEE